MSPHLDNVCPIRRYLLMIHKTLSTLKNKGRKSVWYTIQEHNLKFISCFHWQLTSLLIYIKFNKTFFFFQHIFGSGTAKCHCPTMHKFLSILSIVLQIPQLFNPKSFILLLDYQNKYALQSYIEIPWPGCKKTENFDEFSTRKCTF